MEDKSIELAKEISRLAFDLLQFHSYKQIEPRLKEYKGNLKKLEYKVRYSRWFRFNIKKYLRLKCESVLTPIIGYDDLNFTLINKYKDIIDEQHFDTFVLLKVQHLIRTGKADSLEKAIKLYDENPDFNLSTI